MTDRAMHKANLFIESELWRLVKIRAAEREVTATQILNEALRAYLAPGTHTEPSRRTRKGGRT